MIEDKYFTVKRCCLICDYARHEDIDDHDMLLPCGINEGVMPCKEWYDCCEHFELHRELDVKPEAV
jgi:hypothetical protein